jgi:hypothetical protein
VDDEEAEEVAEELFIDKAPIFGEFSGLQLRGK